MLTVLLECRMDIYVRSMLRENQSSVTALTLRPSAVRPVSFSVTILIIFFFFSFGDSLTMLSRPALYSCPQAIILPRPL